MRQFSKDCKITQCATTVAGAAAATDLNGAAIDMAGFEGVVFIIPFGPIVTAAVAGVKAQMSADAAGSPDDFSDIAGSAQVVADDYDNKSVYIDIFRPAKRYVRPVVTRSVQNATVGGIIAIQYGARRKPVTHDTNVTGEAFVGATEGTA